MAIYIGTSGWSYDHWHGVLYPHGAQPRERLAYYVQQYATVEINSTFYRWPPADVFAGWRRRVPHTFCVTVKAPRGLTHGARLYAPERWIARIARSVAVLGDKLGVLLVQTPPDLAYDLPRLAYFLAQLPSWLRVAFEFRHPSWHQEEVFALCGGGPSVFENGRGAVMMCLRTSTTTATAMPCATPTPCSKCCASVDFLGRSRWIR